MQVHSSTQQVITKFQTNDLHAARSGREVMSALSQVIMDSQATNVKDLVREIEANIDALLEVMPAYAPPLNVMHMIMSKADEALATPCPVDELRAGFSTSAQNFLSWSVGARAKIAQHGSELITDGARVFTFTMSETVLRTLLGAWEGGKKFQVLVTESRPNKDGLLTAQKLSREGINVVVSIDACIGELVPQADIMIVGAEAIMADGSAVCKVGTYPAALVAAAHGVPVYVVVDTLKFNTTSMLGLPMRLDPIERNEVMPPNTPLGAGIAGHLFDETPPDLIQGVVTEKGIISPAVCASLMGDMPMSRTLSAMISARAYSN